MGVSTNAILFYGFCWDEEADIVNLDDVDEGDGHQDWPEMLARKRGHVNPWDACPTAEFEAIADYTTRQLAYDGWRKEHREELDAWYKAQEDIRDEYGVEIGRHCSDECSMPYVYVACSKVLAYRGYPKEITPDMMAVNPEWESMLWRFCADLGIEPPQENPQWWLVSFWG